MTQPTINTQLIDSLVQSILSLSDPEIELFITQLNTAIPTATHQTDPYQMLKQEIELGLKQLRSGQYRTYTSDTLPNLLNDIKRRGQQQASNVGSIA